MHALRELRRNDQSPIYLLSMIARQYRMLIEIKSLLAAGQNNHYEIAKQLGYGAYPVQKAMPLARSIRLRNWRTPWSACWKSTWR
jgi:DNA polymerase III delta subunit